MELETWIGGLVTALAIGLIVGLERGWQARAAREGDRVAGLRTFGLLGLGGGITGLLAIHLGGSLLGFGLLAVAGLLAAGHWRSVDLDHDVGITTVVAGVLTFLLGALAAYGEREAAAASAVVVALLLALKPSLHALLTRIDERDFWAVLRLLLISVVVLPVLPDQDFGPYGALNPFRIWLLVVLISALSFAGYVAMKALGPGRGIALTALTGGLVSSTAATLSFARMAKRTPALRRPLAAGITIANLVMVVRILVVGSLLAPVLALPLAVLALPALLLGGLAALAIGRRRASPPPDGADLANPLALRVALLFALLLAATQLLVSAAEDWLGAGGVVGAALLAGLLDVDAMTVTLANAATGGMDLPLATAAIALTALANTASKSVMLGAVGGIGLARYALPVMGAIVLGGAIGLALVLFLPVPPV
ncbi:MAG: DUF4010 domain-containing protein [Azospirillaceae bacterium]